MIGDEDDYKRPHPRTEHIDFLVSRLLELGDKTHPAGGKESAHLKDLHASWAIRLAGDLAHELAGWAYDYLAGMASEGLSIVPLPPKSLDENDDYKTARIAVSDHRLEAAGAQLGEHGEDMPPPIARQFLANVMQSSPFGMRWSQETRNACEAFEALEVGDTKPLLKTAAKGRKKSFDELRWMLHAVRQVHYRRARGNLLKAAQEEVAAAYGSDAETIRKWETRLRDENGLQVEIVVARAERDAERYKRLIRAFYEGEPDDFGLQILEETYGSAALREAGKAYRLAARERMGSKAQSANQNSAG